MGPSSTLEKLPERPSSPPKNTAQDVEDALDFLDDSNEVDRAVQSNTALSAPLQENFTPTKPSPIISSQESATTAALNAAKRVDFSPWTTVCRDTPGTRHHSTPTRRDIKPLKSILKLSALPPPLTPDEVEKGLSYFSPKEPGSFARMLKSVLQQLASSSTSARLDAYLVINGALKAYDTVPDARAMDQNMDQIMQYVTRDIELKNDSEIMDTNIVTQALKLACAITCDHKLSKAITDEFRTLLVDRAITVMEGAEVPKAIVKTHMFLLAQQRFPATVWTSSRAEKCIAALNTIDNKVSGNNVIATRLVIYQRLLNQARPVMLNSMRDWLDHVFHAMLSSVKEVRIRAIETGEKAALDLGAQYAASKALSDMMNTQVEEGQSYCDYLSLRLQQMIDDKDMNIYVPQIWSVAVLFFRHKRLPLETWKGFKAWLLIIQKCLNKREAKLMRYSMLAWNKLVFVVQPDKNTSPAMLNLLGIPTAHALEKPNRDSKSKKLRPITLGGYYILLHYAFRPGLEFETLDKAWDGYVEPALLGLAKTGTTGRNSACRILHCLFSATAGIWDQEAALDEYLDNDGTDESVDPEYVPMLPVKWVRTRLPRILKIMEPCFTASLWKPVENFTIVESAWTSLMLAISEAGRQEVKTSQELKEAIAILVKMFRSLWASRRLGPAEADLSDWIQLVGKLLDSMVGMLGQPVFAEEILARNRQDDVEAAPTPSHRQSKHHMSLQSPLIFLAGLFLNAPAEATEGYYGRLHSLLTNISRAKASEGARVELFHRSWQSVFKNHSDTASTRVLSSVWRQFALCIEEAVTPEPGAESRGLQGLKLELDNILSVLADGLHYTDADRDTLDSLTLLYQATVTMVRNEAGNGAAVYAVTEPFAKNFLAKGTAVVQTSTMRIARQVVETAPWVLSKQALEQGRRALLGVSLPSNKAPFNPFENTFAMITELLIKTYGGSLEVRALSDVAAFVGTVRRFLAEAPDSLYELAVEKIQEGVAVWLADAGLKTRPNLNYAGVINEIKALYTDVLHRLPNVTPIESTSAIVVTPLLVAGLSSPHKVIVNATVVYWNKTFGTLEDMNYLPELEAALRAREVDAEIILPGLTDEPGHVQPASLPPFFENDDDDLSGPMIPPKAPPKALPKPPTQTAYFTAPQPQPQSSAAFASISRSDSSRRKPNQVSTKATKLRHNDSQIAFAPIDSSPLPPPTLGTEESQHLTEHQKDKLLEQRQAAFAYPDLSSSPVVQSTALQLAKSRQVDRRLDFSSGPVEESAQGQEERELTPTGTPDARTEERSDYLGSSPTPKAAEKAAQEEAAADQEAIEEVEDVEEANEELQDPPSSPPREDEESPELAPAETGDVDGEGDTTMDVTWEPTIASTALQIAQHNEADVEAGEGESARVLDPLPSDCVASNEQLHHEEDTALGNSPIREDRPVIQATAPDEDVNVQPNDNQSETDLDATEVPSSPQQPEEALEQTGQVKGVDYRQSFAASTTDEDNASRISNSFIAPPAPECTDGVSPAGSRRSRRKSAKRKRSESASTTITTPRKRKNVSPYKNPVSYLTSFFRRSQSQQDDDSDMGEDIVVASSQPSYSPAVKRAAEETKDEVDVPGTIHKPDAEPEVESSQFEADAAIPPPKRGRGRPRKSETPTSQPDSQPSQRSQPTRKLKRTASALSNSTRASHDDHNEQGEGDVSVIKDTPAPRPRKAKRRHEGSDKFLIRESQEAEAQTTSQADPESRPPSRSSRCNRSPKVMVPASRSSQQRDDEDVEDHQLATPQRITERPIATPKSILARLRGVLADCGKMILGSQEEREIDDVMFELRREVFSAGRRGREAA